MTTQVRELHASVNILPGYPRTLVCLRYKIGWSGHLTTGVNL
jgi:hypothetical protein